MWGYKAGTVWIITYGRYKNVSGFPSFQAVIHFTDLFLNLECQARNEPLESRVVINDAALESDAALTNPVNQPTGGLKVINHHMVKKRPLRT